MSTSNRSSYVLAMAAAALGLGSFVATPPRAEAGEAGATLTIAVPPERAADAEQKRALDHGQTRPGAPEERRYEEVSEAEARATRRPSGGAGLAGTFGRVFTEDAADGWFGRLELEAFTAGAFQGHGAVGGALIGGELWLAHDAGGGGLPMSFYFGYRSPELFMTFGAGFDLFEVDKVEGDTGFGLYAPFGTVRVGLELGGVRLVADARAIYRWQWGAQDRAQVQVGISMVQLTERPLPRRRHESGASTRAPAATPW